MVSLFLKQNIYMYIYMTKKVILNRTKKTLQFDLDKMLSKGNLVPEKWRVIYKE